MLLNLVEPCVARTNLPVVPYVQEPLLGQYAKLFDDPLTPAVIFVRVANEDLRSCDSFSRWYARLWFRHGAFCLDALVNKLLHTSQFTIDASLRNSIWEAFASQSLIDVGHASVGTLRNRLEQAAHFSERLLHVLLPP
jgi:hypothetical protein